MLRPVKFPSSKAPIPETAELPHGQAFSHDLWDQGLASGGTGRGRLLLDAHREAAPCAAQLSLLIRRLTEHLLLVMARGWVIPRNHTFWLKVSYWVSLTEHNFSNESECYEML